jgi:hypothetical protein
MQAANDNARTPAEHRAYLATLAANQSTTEPRTIAAWPSGERYRRANNFRFMDALNSWNELNGEAQNTIAANDNFADDEEPAYDNKMETQTARATIRRFEAGRHWKHRDEQFIRGYTGEKLPPTPATVDGEDDQIRRIDCARLRVRLGEQTCTILDLAAGDGTLEEIGAIVGVGRKAAAGRVDEAIQKYLTMAA